MAVQQDFSLDLIDHIECSGEQRNALRKFFIHPGVFDGFVGVMVQELRKKPMRPHLCDQKARRALISQFVEKVRERLGDREVRSFAEICEHVPVLELKLRKSQLGDLTELQTHETIDYKLYLQGYHKFCYHHWKP